MVKDNSLLGQAIAEWRRRWAGDIVPYRPVLNLLAASDQAEREWARVIKLAKPPSAIKFAIDLLSVVVMAALASATSARIPGGGPGDDLTSATAATPDDVEHRFQLLFDALELLEDEFDVWRHIRVSEPPGAKEPLAPPATEKVASNRETGDAEQLKAVLGWHAASNGMLPPCDEVTRTHFEYAHFQRIVAPEFLSSLRKHFGQKKAAALSVTQSVPRTRNRGKGAEPRIFIRLLGEQLKPLLGLRRLEFVTSMVTIIYADQENVYSYDAAKQVRRGEEPIPQRRLAPEHSAAK